MAVPTFAFINRNAICALCTVLLASSAFGATTPPPHKTVPAKTAPPVKSGATSGTKTGTSPSGARTGAAAGGSKTNTTGAMKPGTTEKTANGGTRTVTARGAVVTKSATGKVESVRTTNGSTAKFGSNGTVREVHDPARNLTVSHGPGGMRRTEVERPDHSRLVAEGNGRGYIQRTYVYEGHSYYSRAYYYNGAPYNAYYRGYYYNGVYLNGYMPAYYYPPAYYSWAYNPWPAPAPYAWGWGGNPWYGYYRGYFAPYPVYPSASFWLADYLVAASLANAYGALAISGKLSPIVATPHLVYASYDPDSGVTSPTMTKEVKDAVAGEIQSELSAQKAAGAENNAASLKLLLADGKPHVFVASTGITVTSGGQDCGLTDGDVLSLPAAPPADASAAELQVLASKQTDCAKGNTVAVNMADLQEMQNHLLSSIDQGMAQMKEHPGQGGIPAPPADAIAGTKQAPYAASAPAPDPNGAAELDQQAAQGAEVERQVIAEANAQDGGAVAGAAGTSAASDAAPAAASATRPPATVAITLGMTPEEVIASKGQPTNKFNSPTKQVYIYPDMKITFVKGKLTDVQ